MLASSVLAQPPPYPSLLCNTLLLLACLLGLTFHPHLSVSPEPVCQASCPLHHGDSPSPGTGLLSVFTGLCGVSMCTDMPHNTWRSEGNEQDLSSSTWTLRIELGVSLAYGQTFTHSLSSASTCLLQHAPPHPREEYSDSLS